MSKPLPPYVNGQRAAELISMDPSGIYRHLKDPKSGIHQHVFHYEGPGGILKPLLKRKGVMAWGKKQQKA